MNTLYYGDNLKILRNRDYFPNECVDLIYLDPPFNSNRSYNVLFKDESGMEADSQIKAFDDTWHWPNAAPTFHELLQEADNVAEMLQAFHDFLRSNQMMAYLVMMAARLKELHRVLKRTGSLYLHCDPTASHYLKILLDTIFGAENFLNEITWKRTFAHGNVGRNYGSISDIIFFYGKSVKYKWNQSYAQLTKEELLKKYPNIDSDGRRWQSVTLRNPGPRPNLHYPYVASNGVTYQPHPNGWACNRERLEKYDRERRLHFPSRPEGALRLKMYEDESPGEKLQNIWEDIPPLSSQSQERMNYPTQKPSTLLERVIQTSSNESDVVLDPFAGCGTTVAAAQKLKRQWLGIDVTQLSIALLKSRLERDFGLLPKRDYKVVGEPEDLHDAKKLVEDGERYQFQYWALSQLNATPLGGQVGGRSGKVGADRGIDGLKYFFDDNSGKAKKVIIQVKSGHVTVAQIRDLKGTIERDKAAIGVFIALEPPTKPMLQEAADAGVYKGEFFPKLYPRIQILTIEEILAGKQIDMPANIREFGSTEKIAVETHEQPSLLD